MPGLIAAASQGVAGQLVAYWRDRETLEAYLETVDVPRGVELMRKVGVDPAWRIVDVLELG